MKIRIENRREDTSPLEWDVYINDEEHAVYQFDHDANGDIELDVRPKKVVDFMKVISAECEKDFMTPGVRVDVGCVEEEKGTWWLMIPHKEEKKMLNVDKYREDIRNYPLMNIECYLAELRGGEKCKRSKCEECLKNSLRWLFYEHEPPLLKNGDGLKPGDWIMVRDHNDDSWNKMMFAFYYDKTFFVLDDNRCNGHFSTNGVNVTGWKQARRPEESE